MSKLDEPICHKHGRMTLHRDFVKGEKVYKCPNPKCDRWCEYEEEDETFSVNK